MSPETLNAAMAVAISVGTLYCFLGYRALKFIVGLTGFILAGGTAAVIAGYLTSGHLIVMGVAGAIGGLCGAMALFFLYRLGVFFIGLLGALVIAIHVLQGRSDPWVLWAIIGSSVAGGLVALFLERPIITLATAVLGAWVTVSGIAYFLKDVHYVTTLGDSPELTNQQLLLIVSWLLLALLGAFAQFATYRAPRKEVVREVRVS